ncbi:hypothetical protein [Flavobacterium urocaniciphilum]|uniref:Uncharacterized protein n=1 Tax=Flavobacterium urocaniciphilum TaxID=1299341 RepID=A0A1H8YT13_9FLAO|nr:hypothetical protein [Flavobacterium urocaniciphilum]SEP55161.1 hypothetical protein SAMN05444005_101144 [Flavobacterium urocaniciphilum]
MKKLIFGALLSTLFMLFSCGGDDNNETENVLTGSMSATINGSSWSSTNGGAIANVMTVGFGGDSQKSLQIIGIASNTSSFTMNIPIENLAVGSKTFSGDFAEGTLGYISSNQMDVFTSQHTSGNFTVNITTLNLETGKMSGTFSGTLYDDNDVSMSITNGVFTDVVFLSTDYYSNGSMSLKRNSGQVFTMDAFNEDGKFITIMENSGDNSIAIMGNNANLTSDFGIYSLNFPKNIAAGTYALTYDGTYNAGISNSNSQAEFTNVSGSLTITSHTGNTIVGTFSYSANNGSQTVNISNGSFSITHN